MKARKHPPVLKWPKSAGTRELTIVRGLDTFGHDVIAPLVQCTVCSWRSYVVYPKEEG